MPEILDEGNGFLLDEAGVLDYILDEGGPDVAAVKAGGWWQLLDINRYREQEFAFYATNPPMSCPRCGEPLTNAPPTDAGSSVELFCKFDGWQFPRDWMRPLCQVRASATWVAPAAITRTGCCR